MKLRPSGCPWEKLRPPIPSFRSFLDYKILNVRDYKSSINWKKNIKETGLHRVKNKKSKKDPFDTLNCSVLLYYDCVHWCGYAHISQNMYSSQSQLLPPRAPAWISHLQGLHNKPSRWGPTDSLVSSSTLSGLEKLSSALPLV